MHTIENSKSSTSDVESFQKVYISLICIYRFIEDYEYKRQEINIMMDKPSDITIKFVSWLIMFNRMLSIMIDVLSSILDVENVVNIKNSYQ